MAYGDLLAVSNRTGVIYSYDGSWTPLTDTPRPESINTVVQGIVVDPLTDDIVITPSLQSEKPPVFKDNFAFGTEIHGERPILTWGTFTVMQTHYLLQQPTTRLI